jgi:hypothetical protein
VTISIGSIKSASVKIALLIGNNKEIMNNANQEQGSAEYWSEILKPVFGDRKVILAGGVVAAQLQRARQIKALGAESTFILATEGMGAGEHPNSEDGGWFAVEPEHTNTMVDAIHAGNAMLGNLPADALEALDSYDPERSALVVGTFLHEQELVAGRTSLAYRKPEWLAYDDKTVIDSVWDKIGVEREPSVIIPVDKEKLTAATAHMDKGDGVVWSGDSRQGVSGGAVGVRWIRSEADIDKALEYFTVNCDKLRIMPFLEGIPCSIHGVVFSDYVAALRPVEMVVLRKAGSNEFFYAGTATYWDPDPKDREEMRKMAKQVGTALREMVDYRGIFTVDGVMTKTGFRPTEMNTRSGAGIKPLLTGMADFPLELLAQAMVSGTELDYKPEALEALLIKSADIYRGGGTWRAIPGDLEQFDRRPIKRINNGWEWCDEDMADGFVTAGPGPLGSFVRFMPQNTSMPCGPSFAPLAKDFWHFIDTNMSTNIGLLETAQPVR